MTTIDFDSRKLVRPAGGVLVQPYSNATYVTLYAHRPMLNSNGEVWKERGSVMTDRFPQEDFAGMREQAMKGFFPWPVDAEPDMSAYPGTTAQDFEQRVQVMKAFEYYAEKFGAEEPQVIPEPEPVQLPEPTEPRRTYNCDKCEWMPRQVRKNGKPTSDSLKRVYLMNHSKTHAKMATV